MSEPVTYRRASAADAATASRLITLALHDLDRRAGKAPREQPEASAEPALHHLACTDPERFWLAEVAGAPGHGEERVACDGERVACGGERVASGGGPVAERGEQVSPPATADGPLAVGFGAAMVRGSADVPGRLWFLAGLFIHPQWQRRGVGRALLERTLAGYPLPGGVLAVATSAANSQSNTLYARLGMYPLLPTLLLSRPLPVRAAAAESAQRPSRSGARQACEGPSAEISDLSPSRDVMPGGHLRGLEAVPIGVQDVERLRAIDLAVLGVDRTVDHAWLLAEMRRPGWLFLRGGAAAGYGYLGGDGSQVPDQVGPMAALEPDDQPAMAGFLLERATDLGWSSATFMLPGANLALQRFLWSAGFVMDGTAELLGASQPFGRFDRYVFFGDALM
jgi:GNAT superfamily N-acetyltransferase